MKKEASPHLRRCLAVTDSFLCLFVFFPLSILHWRGTWELQDVYFFPAHDRFLDSNWLSFAIGANLSILVLLVQPSIGTLVESKHKIRYAFICRLHMYISGWAVMCYWRGLWNLLDIYLTDHWMNSLVLLVIAQVVCIATCTLRTVVGIPVSIFLDTDPDIMGVDTVFKADPEKTLNFIADCLFSQFVVITCNVVLWRGMWNILDTFFFPHDHLVSDVGSLIVGYVVIIILFSLQSPASIISIYLESSPMCKIFYEDFIFLIMQWGNLFAWRGGWDLCVHYVLPGGIVGPWVSHCIGSVGLMALQLFNNVGLNGVERDGQYPRGEGIFPTKYLQVYLADYIQGHKHAVVSRFDEEDGDGDVSDLSDTDFSDSSTKLLIAAEEHFALKPLSNGAHSNGAATWVGMEINDNHMVQNGNVRMNVSSDEGVS